MPRKPRPLERVEGQLRDCSLIVIASEDRHAVKQYFERLDAKRVQFKVLPTEDGRSSPQALLTRLDAFKKEFDLGEEDQLWVCLDTDHWIASDHIRNLSDVIRQCKQKRFGVAVSRPCFELWIALHFDDAYKFNNDSCVDVVKFLKERCNGYSKRNIGSLPLTTAMVCDAITRAKAADDGKEIPEAPGTQVYLLLEELQRREAIKLV
ncbi:MAG: RloB domain-containing protein [Planctomycetaceae bacterium]|nr:RloB domain-containing protein [Planctomycetaceae bacterium]